MPDKSAGNSKTWLTAAMNSRRMPCYYLPEYARR
jgi:hypothetical protein